MSGFTITDSTELRLPKAHYVIHKFSNVQAVRCSINGWALYLVGRAWFTRSSVALETDKKLEFIRSAFLVAATHSNSGAGDRGRSHCTGYVHTTTRSNRNENVGNKPTKPAM
ncbi:hypothetical protein CBL_01643 [Carabus blaptoides fortunei]